MDDAFLVCGGETIGDVGADLEDLPDRHRASIPVGGKPLGQNLDRDRAPKFGVGGPVHLAHAAGTNRADDLVLPEPRSDHS